MTRATRSILERSKRGHAVRTDRKVAARPFFVVEHLVWFSPFLPAAMVAATATVSVDLDEPL